MASLHHQNRKENCSLLWTRVISFLTDLIKSSEDIIHRNTVVSNVSMSVDTQMYRFRGRNDKLLKEML